MPHKGIFTQSACIFLEAGVSLDQLASCLAPFTVSGRHQGAGSWTSGGPTLTLDYRPEVNGKVVVDAVARPWPDAMGDPDVESEVFAAWATGHFGPYAFPGGLERAMEQSWTWREAAAVVARHRAVVRVRSSYVLGAEESARPLPEAYDALSEIAFVSDVAAKLLALPGALCYFNPNGETLQSRDDFTEALAEAAKHGLPPLDLWANVRLFNLSDEVCLMDTVGMGQLDTPDHEACFRADAFDPDDVDLFLRNISLYVLDNGDHVKDGDTVDGPGEVSWRALRLEEGLGAPPRAALRWSPENGDELPLQVVAELERERDQELEH